MQKEDWLYAKKKKLINTPGDVQKALYFSIGIFYYTENVRKKNTFTSQCVFPCSEDECTQIESNIFLNI